VLPQPRWFKKQAKTLNVNGFLTVFAVMEVEHIAEDKSGRVKFTIEMDINPAMMQLIKENIDTMTDLMAQGGDAMRKQMQSRGKQQGEQMQGGHHGMGYMHHGMSMEQ